MSFVHESFGCFIETKPVIRDFRLSLPLGHLLNGESAWTDRWYIFAPRIACTAVQEQVQPTDLSMQIHGNWRNIQRGNSGQPERLWRFVRRKIRCANPHIGIVSTRDTCFNDPPLSPKRAVPMDRTDAFESVIESALRFDLLNYVRSMTRPCPSFS
jgi:hypothetical protein